MNYVLYKINGFCLKSLLGKEGVSPTVIHNTTWMYYDLLTRIIGKTHTTKFKTSLNYNKGWVKLKSEALKKLYGQETVNEVRNDRYLVIRDRLVKWNIILQHTEQVHETLKTAKYKLLEERLDVDGVSHWNHKDDGVAEPKTLGVALDTSTDLDKLGTTLRVMRINMDRVTIDAEAYDFIQWAKESKLKLKAKRNSKYKLLKNRVVNNTVEHNWNYHIHKIQLKQWGLHNYHPKTSRIYTIIHTLGTELRQFLRIDGRKLVEVDVSNCQPLLFAYFLRKHFAHLPKLPKDVQLWIAECEKGKIYDYLIKMLKKEGINIITSKHADEIKKQKSAFKIEFFKKIFFSTEEINYKWRIIFDKHFQSVSDCITAMKEDAHGDVSVALQKLEAELILQKVTKRLYEAGITGFITVHDSFLTLPEHVNITKQFIEKAFGELDLKCVTKDKLN
jgi:hypothetical protein